MANLYLSHWDATEKVIVPAYMVKKLKSHHVSIVRSIYRCIQKRFSGVVINYDGDINILLAFQALWQAFIDANKMKLPLLIIATDDNIVLWHYHLSQLGNVSLLSNNNHKDVLESNRFSIILVPQMNIKLLQTYEENKFSFVVIEDFDKIVTKRLFKRLEGEFNVALTKRNFMVDRDYKTMWHMLNWTNPGLFGKLGDFEGFDRDHFENLRNPYDDIWYEYCNNVGDFGVDQMETEKQDLEKLLKDWAKKNNFPTNKSPRELRKRKANGSKGTKSKLRKKEAHESENYDNVYHEQSTQIIGCIGADTSVDTTNNFPINDLPKALRKHKANSSKSTKSKLKKNETQDGENYDKVYHEQSTQIIGCLGDDTSADSKNNLSINKLPTILRKHKACATKSTKSKLKKSETQVSECESIGASASDKSPRVLRKHKANSSKRTKSKLKKNKAQESMSGNDKMGHEQSTGITGCLDTNNFIKEPKKLRDIRDLNYTAIMNTKDTVTTSPKKIVAPEVAFQPTFLRNRIAMTKSFELGDKNERNKLLIGIENLKINNSHRSNDKERTLSNNAKQNNFFPSLEDILTLKRPANISPKVSGKAETITTQNIDSIISNTKRDIPNNSDSINITSLEEVFNCKRKLVDNPQISKKLNVNGCSSKLPLDSAKYPDLATKNVPNNTFVNKTIQNHNKFKKINLVGGNVCNTTPKSATMITKETQTEADLENYQQKQDIAVGTVEDVDVNKDVNCNKTKKDGNTNSDIREIGYEDFRGKQENQNSDAPASIHRDRLIDEEDGSILLSVIEGKFTPQTSVRSSNYIKDEGSEDKNGKRHFSRHNSQKLLESLFGDQVDCNDALDKEATDETFSILNLSKLFSSDSQYSSQLRVKTIHEINKDGRSETSQNICESLKILYGDDERSKLMLTDNSPCKIKRGDHNLISSLFG